MAINRLEFLLFYSIFLIFVIYITGLSGQSFLMTAGIENLPQPTGAWWEAFTLPMQYFFAFLFVSSEFAIIFSLILMPFIIGMVLVIAEMIRGN